jgi:Mg/Co/Ni transporter MgtE
MKITLEELKILNRLTQQEIKELFTELDNEQVVKQLEQMKTLNEKIVAEIKGHTKKN